MTTDGAGHPFDAAMESVAGELLGAPNARMSKDQHVRYGTNGSLSVDLTTGTFYDHEAKAGGGVLDLITRVTGRDHRGAIEWMREHGFLESDREPLNGKAAATSLGREVAQYDYVDEDDNPLFQVVRFEPKTFRQRRRDEKGAWSWSVKGVRHVPYRLPDLIEATAMDRTIYIVEGEKDVDNLRKLGLAATCNAGGAGKWRPELNEYFRAANVVILPDHDPQSTNPDGSLRFHPDGRPVFTGQDHAADVARHLHGVAAHVRVLDLARHWPAMPKKGDVSDWMESGGGSPDALQALADRAPEWTANAFVSKFGAQRWEDIGTPGAASCYAWLVEDVIPLNEISMAFGDSGTGKSFDMFDMAMCIARGIKFNGHNVERGLVLYVAAEAGKGFAKRKIAYAIQHQLEPSEPLPFVLLTKRPNFFQDDADVMALIDEIVAIRRSYDQPLVLIVIDTMSAITQGMDEISGKDQSFVRKRLLLLQEKTNAAVVVVHHRPKNGNGPRGHGSITADIETTIEFETVGDRRTDLGKTIHRATVRKQREGKSGIAWEFTLPVIEVGRNKWGNPETSCAVAPHAVNVAKGPIGFHATANEKLFLRALFDALADHGQPPPAGLPPSITKVVDHVHVRTLMRDRVIDPHEDRTVADNRFRGAYKRAGDKLRDGAVIGIQGRLLWYSGKPVSGFTGPMIDGG